MHTLGPTTPARSHRSRGRAAALVAGCSLAVASAFTLPAFAGSGPAPTEGGDAVVFGCAIAGGENVVFPEATSPVPVPVGAKPLPETVLQGIAVEVVAPGDGELPPPGKGVRTGEALVGPMGADGAADITGGAEPIAVEVINVNPDDLQECEAPAR